MNTVRIALYVICIPIALGLGIALIISLFYGLGYGISRLLDKAHANPGASEPKTMILWGFLACIPIAMLVAYFFSNMHH